MALVIAARWNPWAALAVALLFGGGEAAVLRLQAEGGAISPYILACAPYLNCILVVWLGYLRIPGSGGMPTELSNVIR